MLYLEPNTFSGAIPVNTFGKNANARGLPYFTSIDASKTYNALRLRGGLSASNIVVNPNDPPLQVVGTAPAHYYNALDFGFARSMSMAKGKKLIRIQSPVGLRITLKNHAFYWPF